MTSTVSLLSVTEIAANYGRSVAAVHVMAHRKHWRRVKWQGRVYYDLTDVDAAFGKAAVSMT